MGTRSTATRPRWVTKDDQHRLLIKEHRRNFWFVIRRDEWPVGYWNEAHQNWVGSFWGYATMYLTKETAEEVAFDVARLHPKLIGKLDVLEREDV